MEVTREVPTKVVNKGNEARADPPSKNQEDSAVLQNPPKVAKTKQEAKDNRSKEDLVVLPDSSKVVDKTKQEAKDNPSKEDLVVLPEYSSKVVDKTKQEAKDNPSKDKEDLEVLQSSSKVVDKTKQEAKDNEDLKVLQNPTDVVDKNNIAKDTSNNKKEKEDLEVLQNPSKGVDKTNDAKDNSTNKTTKQGDLKVLQSPKKVVENTAVAKDNSNNKKKEDLELEEEEEEEVVEETSLVKRRSAATSSTRSTASDNGSTLTTSTIYTSISSSPESAWSASTVATYDQFHASRIDESINDDYEKLQGNMVYFEKGEGAEVVEMEWSESAVNEDGTAAKLEDVDIEAMRRAAEVAMDARQIENLEEVKTYEVAGKKRSESVVTYEYEESDEEVVELEFDTAVEKMHTHDGYSMYCPNCSSKIAKVVLRRKIKRRRIVVVPAESERRELLGCLSCFSVFIPSGDKLNLFRMFGARRGEQRIQQVEEQPTSDVALPTSDVALPTSDVTLPTAESTQAEERGFDMLWFLRKRRVVDESSLTSPLLPETETQPSTTATSTEAATQPPPTIVTPKPKDEVIITPRPREEAITPKPRDEVIPTKPKEEAVTPKPRDEAIEKAIKEREEKIQLPQEQPPSKLTEQEAAGKGFDLFRIFRKRRETDSDLTSPLIAAAASIPTSTPAFISAGVQTAPIAAKTKDKATERELPVSLPAKDTSSAASAYQTVISTAAVGKPESKEVPTAAVGKDSFEKPESKEVPTVADGKENIEKPESKQVPSVAAVEKVPQKPESKEDASIAAVEKISQKPESKEVSSAAAVEKVPQKLESKKVPSVAAAEKVTQKLESEEVPSVGAAAEKVLQKLESKKVPSVAAAAEKVPQKLESKKVPSVAAVQKVPQPSLPQVPVLNDNVIIDVFEKSGVLIAGAKQPLQPVPQVTTDGPPPVGEVRIPVVEETPGETGIPREAEDVTITTATQVIVTEPGSPVLLEIVKSIVYGGLMESIISLVIVSLASASYATTWNVMALGFACLVGGFFLLAHYLRVLRYGHPSQTNEQRYREQLGRAELFPLHATVAVVSYVIFGVIPPVVYGFTFRETDDREFKMLAVAAASLVCIVILSTALTYVRGDHRFMAYFKTVLYYVILAALASGAAFAVGYFIRDPFPCPTALSI